MSSGAPTIPAEADCPEQWVARHGDYLFRYALHRTADASIAEDLVQETLVSALEAARGFDGRSAFRTWLTSILRHKIADHFRQRESVPTPADVAALDEWADGLFGRRGKWRRSPERWGKSAGAGEEQADLARALTGCLHKLPPQLAELFVMYEQHQVPGPRLAAEVGVTTGNLWVRLYRARTALRDCLERNWFGKGAR